MTSRDKLAIGARALRFAKVDKLLGNLVGSPQASGSVKQMAKQIADTRSGQGILRAGDTSPLLGKLPQGYGKLESINSLRSQLRGAASSAPVRQNISDRLRQLSLDTDLSVFSPRTPPRLLGQKTRFDTANSIRERVAALQEARAARLAGPSGRAPVRGFGNIDPAAADDFYNSIAAMGSSTGEGSVLRALRELSKRYAGQGTRYSAFNQNTVGQVGTGKPVWYTPSNSVLGKYFGREGRNLLGVTKEQTLRQFGPLGPVTGHVGKDNRSVQQVTGFLARLRDRLVGPRFEQVATMPDMETFIKNHDWYRWNQDALQKLPARAFGK